MKFIDNYISGWGLAVAAVLCITILGCINVGQALTFVPFIDIELVQKERHYQAELANNLIKADAEAIRQSEAQAYFDALVAERIAREEEAARIAEEERLAAEAAAAAYYAPSYYNGGGGSRELRMYIESRGNYGTDTGNGYLGAYQFAEQYMAGRMAAAGIPWEGREDFLNSPEKQDALADWYANSRYGGWENTPSSGGW